MCQGLQQLEESAANNSAVRAASYHPFSLCTLALIEQRRRDLRASQPVASPETAPWGYQVLCSFT